MEKKEEINKETLKLNSEKIKEREIKIKIVRISILILILFLIIIYFLLMVIYETGKFTISMDPMLMDNSGLVMYESLDTKQIRRILEADRKEFIDNISVNWLPNNINEEADGSHNGDNYIAYTFYVENQGANQINYWYTVVVDDVIRNVDKAIRIRIYHNGVSTTYAKSNEQTGEAEYGTTAFFSDNNPVVESRRDFNPGDIDKFTIVIWIEGDDPDCIDELIGGEMKMHMEITSERIQ